MNSRLFLMKGLIYQVFNVSKLPKWKSGKAVEDDDIGLPFCVRASCAEIEFMDVSLTKVPSLLLHCYSQSLRLRSLENQTKT
jgi:hypothetical protein